MSITAWILLVVAALVAIVLLLAALRSDVFRVERRVRIGAAPEQVFALVADLRQFNRWNPWERKDPGQGRYGDRSQGPGASYAWDSKKLGAGSMTIVEAQAPTCMRMRLDFLRPMKATHTAEFTLQREGDATSLSWAMFGESNFVARLMHLFIDIDRMLGRDFEAGLAELKAIAEAAPRAKG